MLKSAISTERQEMPCSRAMLRRLASVIPIHSFLLAGLQSVDSMLGIL
jgi:hypothetical protein